MSLLDTFTSSMKSVDDYVAKQSDEISKSIMGATNRAKRSPGGKLQIDMQKRVIQPSMDLVQSNPVINMGIDTANEAITKVTQQLITTGVKQLEATINKVVGINIRKTIQDAVNSYFNILAVATTAQVEVIMELARVTARQLIKITKQKDDIIRQVQDKMTQLFNAIQIILNSQPFFTDYLQRCLQAYQLIQQGNGDLKQVSNILQRLQRYQEQTFNRALGELTQARDLLLPDRGADIKEILSPDYLLGIVKRKANIDGLAAALSIPGITFAIGKLMLQYVFYTVQINGLIQIFLTYLNSAIQASKTSPNIYQTEIDHINSATKQLDSLLADMQVVLFPTDGREKSPLYPGQVTTSGTGWGMRLTTIIEYLKIHPGNAVKTLDLTSDSVALYNQAVADLKKIQTKKTQYAQLVIVDAQESTDAALTTGKLLIIANTVIATQNAPADVKLLFFAQRDRLKMALELDNDIRNALQPFVTSELGILAGADKVLNSLSKLAKDLGLDRIADLLAKGDLKNIYSATSATATYAGAAVVGLGSVMSVMKTFPDVTDRAMGAIAKVRDAFIANNDVKNVETQRSSEDTEVAFVAEQQQKLDQQKEDVQTATKVIQAKDPTGATTAPLERMSTTIADAGPGTDSLGGILDNQPPSSGGIYGGNVPTEVA